MAGFRAPSRGVPPHHVVGAMARRLANGRRETVRQVTVVRTASVARAAITAHRAIVFLPPASSEPPLSAFLTPMRLSAPHAADPTWGRRRQGGSAAHRERRDNRCRALTEHTVKP